MSARNQLIGKTNKLFFYLFLVVLVNVTHAQWTGGASLGVGNKGPDLKLSVGRTAGKWTFKGWGSTDFSRGWKAGVSVGIKFKRSTHDVLPKYNILIQANQCHFDVYDENGDGIITLEEMTSLFKDKELGANLFYDLHISKDNPGIMELEFYERIQLVIKGCAL
ncbi:uncharacterized protein LOC144623511 [Crassostrea virginica]